MAFIYRDWWSLQSRCKYDLRDLRRALSNPGFPAGGETAREWLLLLTATETGRAADTAEVPARRCDNCGGELQAAPDRQVFSAPAAMPRRSRKLKRDVQRNGECPLCLSALPGGYCRVGHSELAREYRPRPPLGRLTLPPYT